VTMILVDMRFAFKNMAVLPVAYKVSILYHSLLKINRGAG